MNLFKKFLNFIKTDEGIKPVNYLNNSDELPSIEKIKEIIKHQQKNSLQEQQEQQEQQIIKPNDKLADFQYNNIEVRFLNPPSRAGNWYYLSESSNYIYEVDLNKVQCDCYCFLTERNFYDIDDARRYCKHLFFLSRQSGFCSKLNCENELIEFYLNRCYENNFSLGTNFYLISIDKNDILVILNSNSDWIDIFTRKKRTIDKEKCTGEIERYGYNFEKNRWAYGYAPYKPLKIKSYINLLPKFNSIQNNIPTHKVEFTISSVLKLKEEYFFTENFITAIYDELCNSVDYALVENILTKLNKLPNINKKTHAFNWKNHGINLSKKVPALANDFFENALPRPQNLWVGG